MKRGIVGIFDSGVGGISVLQTLIREFPNNDYVYLFDKSGLPYGDKDEEEIIDRTCKNVEFLKNKGAEVVVVGCNTASCIALDSVRTKYNFPIFGVLPPIERVIKDGCTNVLLIATPLTIRKTYCNYAEKYEDKIEFCALKNLASIIETDFQDKEKIYAYARFIIEKHLSKMDALILGCTHYYFLRDYFANNLKLKIYDGLEELINQIKGCNVVSKEKNYTNKTVFFYS